LRSFTELCGKPILPNWIIAQALETIQFKMDEAGVKLKSEAGMMAVKRGASVSTTTPRYFNFDARYAVFIAEKGKKPYFALLVNDAASLQKNKEKEAAAAQRTEEMRSQYTQGLEVFMQDDFEAALEHWNEAAELAPETKEVNAKLKQITQIVEKAKAKAKANSK